MQRKFISDFQVNEVLTTFAMMRSVQVRVRKTGEEFLSLELQDRTGAIEARVWEIEDSMRQLRPGDYVKVKARVEDYKGRLQLMVERIRRITDSDRDQGFDESDCIISTPYEIEEMWSRLLALVNREVTDPFVSALLKNILESTAVSFKSYPAAQEIHHGYRGGFLEHVLSVTENCVYFANHYPDADKNLLVAGGILHDIGKLEELTPAPAIEYTTAGRLIGHIVLGRDLVRREAAKIEGFPEQTLLLLEHLILSHQGDYDWGSPKRPKVLEALILHYLDDLDAKVNHLQGVLRAHRGDSEFTHYDRILGRVLFKRKQASPPDETLQPREEAELQGELQLELRHPDE
ncbi:MAG TPA: HD domain-containing protein [Acidobacteriota bacterium]|jgi:3'-5' exoribonuclease